MMKKAVKRVVAAVGLLLLLIILIAGCMFFNEIRSLASLKKVDDYPMYEMVYYGDYGFDEFLQTGCKTDAELEAFVTKRLLKGFPIDLGVVGDGCTAMVTRNEKYEVLFGRNFDFSYAPSLQVKTTPKNGYASISTVNLTFAGYSKGHLPNGLRIESFMTLAAPFLPFDGLNEKGVAIALLAVPKVQLPEDANKLTLNTTTAIRLVLDKAASVDEAVELLRGYNIYFSGGIDCHFLIADSTGKSVIVEYWDGEMRTVYPAEPYQIASNFIAYDGLNIGEGYTEFDRYDMAEKAIVMNNGALTNQQVIDLLAKIGVYSPSGENRLQWSVVYNLTSLEGEIFAGRNTENVIDFKLAP